jgi:hypothetical protein
MVMSERVPCRVPRRAALAVSALALLALPAWTLAQRAATSAADTVNPASGDPFLREDPKPAQPAARKKATAEDKLRDLEERVKALTRELEALRKARTGGHTGTAGARPPSSTRPWFGGPGPRPKSSAAPPTEEVVLTRTTYRLPAGKGEALGKFLKEHVKASVLETKVDGDKLIVTTTPAAQRVIGQLILLIQGKLPTSDAFSPYYMRRG